MNYKKITTQAFAEVIGGPLKPSVLVFGAEWSGSAEIVDSMMERVSQEFNSGVEFFKVDLEEQTDISKFFKIQSVPTIILLKDGEVVEQIKGFIPAKKVRKKIKDIYFQNNEEEEE